MRYLLLIVSIFFANNLSAQYGYDAKWIVGQNGAFANFNNDTSKPMKGRLFGINSPNFEYYFHYGTSNID